MAHIQVSTSASQNVTFTAQRSTVFCFSQRSSFARCDTIHLRRKLLGALFAGIPFATLWARGERICVSHQGQSVPANFGCFQNSIWDWNKAGHCSVSSNPPEYAWLFMENLTLTQQMGTNKSLKVGMEGWREEKSDGAFKKHLWSLYFYRNVKKVCLISFSNQLSSNWI